MADSTLLTMYRALEDPELGQRVQGAAVKYAHYLQGNSGASAAAQAFAEYVLDAPTRQIPELVLRVAADQSILASIKLDRNGNADAYLVEDAAISYVVEANWETVWSKVSGDVTQAPPA